MFRRGPSCELQLSPRLSAVGMTEFASAVASLWGLRQDSRVFIFQRRHGYLGDDVGPQDRKHDASRMYGGFWNHVTQCGANFRVRDGQSEYYKRKREKHVVQA